MSTQRSRSDQHHDRVVKAVLALYDNKLAGEPSPCDVTQPANRTSIGVPTDVDDVWHPEVTFNDPLMKVTGWQHYRAQFAALHALFPIITMQVYSVTWGHGSGKLTSADDVLPPASLAPNETTWEHCVIDARCTYGGTWFSIPVRQTSHLRLTKEAGGLGKIIAHEDTWSFADLVRGVPLIGRFYNWYQPRMGAFVSERILSRYAKQADVDPEFKNLSTNTLHAVYHPIEAERVGSIGKGQQKKSADISAAAAKAGEEKKSRAFSGEKKEL